MRFELSDEKILFLLLVGGVCISICMRISIWGCVGDGISGRGRRFLSITTRNNAQSERDDIGTTSPGQCSIDFRANSVLVLDTSLCEDFHIRLIDRGQDGGRLATEYV